VLLLNYGGVTFLYSRS